MLGDNWNRDKAFATLMDAVGYKSGGDAEAVEEILTTAIGAGKLIELLSAKDKRGNTALSTAEGAGSMRVVKILKAAVSFIDASGNFPLKAAISRKDLAAVDALLKQGADPYDIKDKDGKNALTLARESGNPKILNMVIAKCEQIRKDRVRSYKDWLAGAATTIAVAVGAVLLLSALASVALATLGVVGFGVGVAVTAGYALLPAAAVGLLLLPAVLYARHKAVKIEKDIAAAKTVLSTLPTPAKQQEVEQEARREEESVPKLAATAVSTYKADTSTLDIQTKLGTVTQSSIPGNEPPAPSVSIVPPKITIPLVSHQPYEPKQSPIKEVVGAAKAVADSMQTLVDVLREKQPPQSQLPEPAITPATETEGEKPNLKKIE